MYLTISGTDRTSLIAKRGLRYTGRPDSHNLDIDINTQASVYMPRMGEDMKLYSSSGGTLIFGGVIKTLRKQKLEPMRSSSAYTQISLSSDGYNAIPARRTVSLNFTTNETGNMISALRTIGLNNATFGNDNVGLGSITSGVTLEADYYSLECQSIKEAFDDLALMSGCKWYIGNDKALNFVSEDTITTANHTISATDTTANLVHDITVTESLENYANKIFAVGGIGDDGNLIYATASNTSAITTRAAIEGTANSSGVYGFIIQSDTIDSMTAASTVADMHIKKYGYEPQEITFYSWETDWVAGTQVLVNLPEFGMTAAITCLIEEVTLTIDSNNIFKTYVKCARREAATFSTHQADGGVQYFERILANNNGGGGSTNLYATPGSGAGGIANYQDTTTATATVTTAETIITSVAFNLSRKCDIHMTFSAYLQVTAAVTVTGKTYLNEGTATTTTFTFQPKQNLSGNETFAFNDFYESISAGTTTLTVKLISDTGTITVNTGQAAMNILVFPRSLTPTFTALVTNPTDGYIMFGFDDAVQNRDCDEYDPDTWTSKTDGPVPVRYGNAASAISGKCYSYGGYTSAATVDCDEYDPVGNAWANKTDMTQAKYRHAASTILGKGYVYAGYTSAASATCYEYDASANSWTGKTDVTAARYWPTAATILDKGYVVGGSDSGFAATTSNYQYDSVGNSWATKAVFTGGSLTGGNIAGCSISDKGYYWGYFSAGNINNEYDPVGDSWSIKTDTPAPDRLETTALNIDGKGYAICGRANAGAPIQDCDEYDTVADTWANKTNSPAPARTYLAAASL